MSDVMIFPGLTVFFSDENIGKIKAHLLFLPLTETCKNTVLCVHILVKWQLLLYKLCNLYLCVV